MGGHTHEEDKIVFITTLKDLINVMLLGFGTPPDPWKEKKM